MTAQIGCLLTRITGDGTINPYRPSFADNAQVGEHWSWNLVDLHSTISQLHNNLPSADIVAKHDVPMAITPAGSLAGIAFVYAYADHTRINLANAQANHHLLWSYTIDRAALGTAPELNPSANTLSAEITPTRDYIAAQYGVTGTQVTNWLAAKFNRTPAQLSAFITSNPRSEFVRRLAAEILAYAQTKAELDNA